MEAAPARRRRIAILNRLGLGSLLVGIVAGVVKAWVTQWLGPTPTPPPVPPPAAIVEQLTVERLLRSSPVTLMQWQMGTEATYATNSQRERMFREYLGREVVWEGYFDQYHPLTDGATEDKAFTLILHESRSTLFSEQILGPPITRCWMPASAASQLRTLQRGQWVVVRGRLSDPMLAGTVLCTDLYPCEIIASAPVRDVQMTLADDQGSTVRR